MKKLMVLLVSCCMLCALAFNIHQPEAAAVIKLLNNTVNDSAYYDVYTSYDITNDQKKDRIVLDVSYDYWDDVYTGVKLTINGNRALNITFDDSDWVIGTEVYYLKLSNNKTYIIVHALSEDDEPVVSTLYRYKSGKLVRVRDFADAFSWFKGGYYIENIKVKNKSIIVSYFSDSTMIGHGDFKATYNYSSFKAPTSVTYTRFNNYNYGKYLIGKTSTKFPVYKTAGKSKTVATIKKGTKFYPLGFKKVSGKVYYHVKVGNKKGYIIHKYSMDKYFKYEAHSITL